MPKSNYFFGHEAGERIGKFAHEQQAQNAAANSEIANRGLMPEGAYSSNYLPEKRPSGYKKYRSNNYTPAQMQLYNQLYGLVDPQSITSRLAMGDEDLMAEYENPALKQFNTFQSNLASKFSGQGMGARRSSGFKNASSAASQDFVNQLRANRQNLQRQATMDLMGLSQQLLQGGPYSTGYVQKGDSGGIAGGYGAPVGTAAGAAIGTYYGNPQAGAAIGGSLGGLFD